MNNMSSRPPKGIRAVRGRLVPDRNGMPVIEIDHDSLVRAAWELTLEKFGIDQPPAPPSRWSRLRGWLCNFLPKLSRPC